MVPHIEFELLCADPVSLGEAALLLPELLVDLEFNLDLFMLYLGDENGMFLLIL